MLLTLLTLRLLQQTTWEWVDSAGETHFTDDRSTIPKGARARTTEGADISEMPMPAPRVKTTTTPTATPAVGACAKARANLDKAEQALTTATRTRRATEAAYHNACGTLTGEDAAECERKMPGYRPSRRPRAEPTLPDLTPWEKAVERARDDLRKVQLAGCSS